jgi:hypothetical protein
MTFCASSEYMTLAPLFFCHLRVILFISRIEATFPAVSFPSTFSRPRVATYFLESPHYQVRLPSQRFARSQGFTPPATCWPYFMPVPSLGFFPFKVDIHLLSRMLFRASFPSCCSLVSFRWLLFAWLRSISQECFHSLQRRSRTNRSYPSLLSRSQVPECSCNFRVLLPASVRTANRWFRSVRSRNLHGLFPP